MKTFLRPVAIVLILSVILAAVIWPRIRPEDPPKLDLNATSPGGVVGLIVEPDDGRAPVLSELDAAERSIDAMLYLLTDEPVINALIDAEERGVEVRVILEQYPFGGSGNPEETATLLRNAGVEVKWARDDVTFSHVKTIVVDSAAALIMNLNVSRTAFESNRDFALVTTRAADVAAAAAIFEADWGDEPVESPGSLIVSPLNSRSSIAQLLSSARVSIDIYAEVIRDDAIVAQLIAIDAAGVPVRIVISPENDPVGVAILDELQEGGVEVRLVDRPYIHAKAILVDGASAFIGSQNLTATSLDENREIGLIVVDAVIVGRLESVFERDFASGHAHEQEEET